MRGRARFRPGHRPDARRPVGRTALLGLQPANDARDRRHDRSHRSRCPQDQRWAKAYTVRIAIRLEEIARLGNVRLVPGMPVEVFSRPMIAAPFRTSPSRCTIKCSAPSRAGDRLAVRIVGRPTAPCPALCSCTIGDVQPRTAVHSPRLTCYFRSATGEMVGCELRPAPNGGRAIAFETRP